MSFEVKKAKRQRRPLKVGLEGLSGSGKTYSALRLGFAMRRAGIGRRIVVADSENNSADLYDGVSIDGEVWNYETCAIPTEKRNPAGYTEVYEYLVGQGFDIIIIDSMTHAWKGALNRVDQLSEASRSKDKFGVGWKVVTPEQEQMIGVLTDTRAHLITTTRVKGEYERAEGNDGKGKIKKIGLKADQRDGMEYEYDCVVRLDNEDHLAVVEKVRGCQQMDGRSGKRPGPDFWKPLFDWWLSAEPVLSLEDQHIAGIRGAGTLETLQANMALINKDVKAGKLKEPSIARITAEKDKRKAELSPPSPAPTTPVPATESPLPDFSEKGDVS